MEANTYLDEIAMHLESRVSPPLDAATGNGQRFEADRVGKLYDTCHREPGDVTGRVTRKCVYDFLGDGDDQSVPMARLDAYEVARTLNRKVSEAGGVLQHQTA